MINSILNALNYDFFLYGLLTVTIFAPICGSFGVMVTQSKMSFFSDAIAHSLFAGLALSLLLNISQLPTLLIFAAIFAIGITYTRRKTKESSDTVIGAFFTASVALGIILIYMARKQGIQVQSIEGFLFGDILGISKSDFTLVLILTLIAGVALIALHNRLMFVITAPQIAASRGVRVALYEYLFSVMLALVVVTGVKALGVLMVNSLLILPAAASKNMATNHGKNLFFSIIIGLISGVVGLVGSFVLDVPSGAAIVLVAAIIFFMSILFNKK